MVFLTSLRRWWRKEQLITATLKALTAGAGVTQQRWPASTPPAALLAWYEHHLADTRTPYGLRAARIVVVAASRVVFDETIGRTQPWFDIREQVEQVVTPLLVERDVTTAVISFGTAVQAVLSATENGTTS